MKLVSWNVNGIRAGIRKGFWNRVNELDQPDIICIQETKTDAEKMQQEIIPQFEENNYNTVFNSADKKGYSGVAIMLDKKLGIQTPGDDIFGGRAEDHGIVTKLNNKFDEEGRYSEVKIKQGNLEFTLINCYYPQGGRGQHRIDYKIEFYNVVIDRVKELKADGEKVLLTGDFNTTFTSIDLARPKENKKNTGCLPEEREVLNDMAELGLTDAFRHFYPNKVDMYSYWDQKTRARDRNVGWRIDFWLVDKELMNRVESCEIVTDMMGSDHAPVTLVLK